MRFAVALLVVVAGCSKSDPPPKTAGLAERVEQERQPSAEAVDAYVPKVTGRIDALAKPAADILRQLPAVADVEVLVTSPKPTHRIIQLRDWHYVPPELFALDVRQVAGRPLSDEAVEKLYQKHLLEVELVQIEQGVLLRCLVEHHGLRRVLAEGLTPQGLANFKEIIASLRDMDKQVAEMQKMRAKFKEDAPAIDEMVREHRRRLLEYGAAVQLEIANLTLAGLMALVGVFLLNIVAERMGEGERGPAVGPMLALPAIDFNRRGRAASPGYKPSNQRPASCARPPGGCPGWGKGILGASTSGCFQVRT
jgi:hypothetical protein